MKKTLLIVAVAAMSFVACNKAEMQTASKGMTLSAIVDDNIKATIDKNSETGKWNFSWQTGDIVGVISPEGPSYDFTFDGISCKSETAVPAEGEWTAVYPTNAQSSEFTIKIQEKDNSATQDGTLESVMKNYLMVGSVYCEEAETAIKIKMTPKIAIVKITNSTDKQINFNFSKRKPTNPVDNTHNYVATIDKDGNISSTNNYSQCYAGSIPVGGANWYIAPAAQIYLVTDNGGSTKSYRGPKTLEAGKVYNVVL